MKGTVTDGADPYFFKTSTAGFSTSSMDSVEIRMKVPQHAVRGQIFYANANFTQENSAYFDFANDGSFHNYRIYLGDLQSTMTSIKSFRIDIEGTEAGDVIEIDNISLFSESNKTLPIKTERVWHVYPDKIHLENKLYFTSAVNLADAYAEISLNKSQITQSTYATNSESGIINGSISSDNMKYVGANCGSLGAIGFVFPNVTEHRNVRIVDGETSYKILSKITIPNVINPGVTSGNSFKLYSSADLYGIQGSAEDEYEPLDGTSFMQ